MTEINGGSLGSRERFDRLELAQREIERLLTDKLTRAEIGVGNLLDASAHIQDRLTALEAGANPVMQLFRTDMMEVRSDVHELTERGSAQARQALVQMASVEKEVGMLHDDFEQRKGQQAADATRFRIYTTALLTLQVLTMVFSFLTAARVIH